MSLLWMTRTGVWNREQATVAPWAPDRRVLFAAIPETIEEPDPESEVEGATRELPSNVYAELEQLVDHCREAEAANPPSGQGPGLAAFPDLHAALSTTPTANEEDDTDSE